MNMKRVGQAWRSLRPGPRHSLTFNPSLDILFKSNGRRKVVFIHTGKCAGETILNLLRKSYIKPTDFIEYHCFNANHLIQELFSGLEGVGQPPVTLFIATRDPIARWVSSFNWDLYNRFLVKGKELTLGYHEFPDVKRLAQGILDGSQNALIFGRKGHMGMGISWYLPLELVDRLPVASTFVIRQELLEQDLLNALAVVARNDGATRARRQISLPHTKGSFKSLCSEVRFKDVTDLSQGQIDGLKDYLSEDYRVNEALIKRFD
jgi:hypothetical protein